MATLDKRRDIKVDAVFDIETSNWTQFVCGGILWADGAYQAFDHRAEDAMVDALLGTPGDIWSHNGGRFDTLWLLTHVLRRGLKASAVSAGSRVVAARVGRTRFLDSKALTKISLRDLTRGMAVEKQRLNFECVGKPDCERPCEGYCAISRDMPREQWRRLLEYLEADCRSLMSALGALRDFAAEHDLDLTHTIGGSAWANARRMLELEPARLTASDHRFFRRAYYGGRVQLFRPWSDAGWQYDVNALYPSRLALYTLPVGEPERAWGSDARAALSRDLPGAYRCRVSVPESFVPPLPYRVPGKKDGRIYYPTGEFSGTWTLPELRHASDAGVTILDVAESVTFPSETIIFREWVDKLFALRTKAPGGKKSPLGTFLKFYANSLTGKLGARPDTERVLLNPDDIKTCPEFGEWGNGECTPEDCCGLCGAMTPLADTAPIYSSKSWRLSSNSHVEWAAYLTAEGRAEWGRQARSVDDGADLVYGDTDSVFSERERAQWLGSERGQWAEEGRWRNFVGRAPKVYRYDRCSDDGWEPVHKAKGVPLPRDPVLAERAIRELAPVSKGGVDGFRHAARAGHFFRRTVLTRQLSQGYGDRVLDGDVTRPRRVREDGGIE